MTRKRTFKGRGTVYPATLAIWKKVMQMHSSKILIPLSPFFLFLLDNLAFFQLRLVFLVAFFAVIGGLFFQVDRFAVEFPMVGEQDKVGHVVGEGNAGAFQIVGKAGASEEAPIVHDATSEGGVQFFANAVFGHQQELRLFFGRDEFVQLEQGVVQVFGDVDPEETILFDALLILALVFLFVVGRPRLAENWVGTGEKKSEYDPKAVFLHINTMC